MRRSRLRGERRHRSLGSCPECGRDVRPDAGALPYRGGFYHVVCALWRRERGGRALAAAR